MDNLHKAKSSTTVMKFIRGDDMNIANMDELIFSCMQCMKMAEICIKECSNHEDCVHCCIAVSEACSAFARMCSRGIMDRSFVKVCIELCEHCSVLCKNDGNHCMKNCNEACKKFVSELNKCFA